MPVVHLRSRHGVHGHLDWTSDDIIKKPRGKYIFLIEGVEVEVDPGENMILARLAADLSQPAIDSLGEWLVTHRAPLAYHDEVAPLMDKICAAVGRLVDILCFTYPMDALRGATFGDLHWSLDTESWERALIPSNAIGLGSASMRIIDEESMPVIRGQLDANVKPLEAFRHVQRAEREHNPRHMWIDAAIAAELGIKEFLARRIPEVVPLLLDVPSPPLSKLYGSILKAYDGSPSPWATRLQDGANRRNDLVHKHTSATPDAQEAANYVNLVVAVLYDLMARLYPDDPTIADLRADKAGLVECEDARTKKMQEEARRAEKERARQAKRQRTPTDR